MYSSNSVRLPNIPHVHPGARSTPSSLSLEKPGRRPSSAQLPLLKNSPPLFFSLLWMGLAGLAGGLPLAARSSQVPWLCCVAVCSAWLWSCCSGSGRWTWYSLWQCRPAPGGALPPCVAHFYALVSFVAFGQSGRTLLWVVAESIPYTQLANWLNAMRSDTFRIYQHSVLRPRAMQDPHFPWFCARLGKARTDVLPRDGLLPAAIKDAIADFASLCIVRIIPEVPPASQTP